MATAASPTTTSSSPSPFSVSGKTAIVTGAGSGINLAFASLLLSHGCNIVLADLALRPEAEALVRRHRDAAAAGPRAVFVETDVTSWPALARLFDAAAAAFGDVHVVCPGAGVYEPRRSGFWHPPGSAASGDAADGRPGHYALLDVNLTHPIRTTQLALSRWLHPPPPPTAAGGTTTAAAAAAAAAPCTRASPASPRRVVHVGSVAGQLPNLNAPLYAASKFAVHGFVRSLAPLDARVGVRVNAVAPGVVRTPLWVEHPDKMKFLDPGRDGWVTPDEVAAAMLRCVEDEGLVGGTILEVGKGSTRCVETLGDPGPSMDPRDGLVVRNAHEGNADVYRWLDDGSIWGQF